jgi:hypothetical protein
MQSGAKHLASVVITIATSAREMLRLRLCMTFFYSTFFPFAGFSSFAIQMDFWLTNSRMPR